MKKILFTALAICTLSCHANEDPATDFPELTGLYFGQKLPGLTPEVFAPGIVSVEGRYEYGVSFSPKLDEMYFSPTVGGHSVIYYSKVKNGFWTAPQKADFTGGKIADEFGAVVSHSNNRIYFSTYHEDYPLKIWYVNRIGDKWSDAKLLKSSVNDDEVIFSSEAKNGDIFYINSSKKHMYFARNENGNFLHGEKVAIPYGSQGVISPNQDFMLVEGRKHNNQGKRA